MNNFTEQAGNRPYTNAIVSVSERMTIIFFPYIEVPCKGALNNHGCGVPVKSKWTWTTGHAEPHIKILQLNPPFPPHSGGFAEEKKGETWEIFSKV